MQSMRRNFAALATAGIAAFGAGAVLADPPQPEWTLFSPIASTSTYLIDLNGVVQHQWPSSYRPGQSVYLLDAGGLLRTCNDTSTGGFNAGGRGGRLQRLAWDGAVQWNYLLADADKCQHHDAHVMPNGNVLAIVWERKTVAEAVAAGRNPATLSTGELWSEMLLEIEPTGTTGGTVVWQWHAWDHLVQNFDATKPNFAQPSNRPERVNLNYPAPAGPVSADWLHINGIDYNAALDQIVVSARTFDEIWIISHDPASSGDLLYRWGNPVAYGMGTAADQKLFGQHNPQWIADGLSGAGDILLYDNGAGRPAGAYSSVEQIRPPLLPDGTYSRQSGQPFGPSGPAWMCDEASSAPFYSASISGAQRLTNGNTLICVGSSGVFIEMDAACQTVWQYTNPFVGGGGSNAVFRATRIDSRDPRVEGLLYCSIHVSNDGSLAATIYPHGSAKFSVTASGAGPFSYQWQYQGGAATDWTNLTNGPNMVNDQFLLNAAGADAASVTVDRNPIGWAVGNAGQFRCMVTNACGNLASSAATLTVIVDIPAVSSLGLLTCALGLLAAGSVILRRQRSLASQDGSYGIRSA